MSKHTAGPWEWIDRGEWHELVHYLPGETFKNSEPRYVRIHSDGSAGGEYGPDIDVSGPDARLIAAAPDLLAACKRATEFVRLNEPFAVEMIGELEDAIRLAEQQ